MNRVETVVQILDNAVGGVPLGLAIAEDIFKSGMKQSCVEPRN